MANWDAFSPDVLRSRRSDEAAGFAAAVIVLGVAAIVTLDRVGAPSGLIRALGPLLALALVAIVGMAARNADLSSFLAARRGVAPLYGGLTFVAIAAGGGLALSSGERASDLSLAGLAAGAAVGAAGFGPLMRHIGATWPSDLIATRFPSWTVRLPAGAAIFAAAALIALAGFSLAVEVVQAFVTPNPVLAGALVAAALTLTSAPGGLASLIWTAAACGGVLMTNAAAAAALGEPFAFADGGGAAPGLGSGAVAALASASLFAFEAQAFASPSARAAAKAAIIGFALCVVAAALASGAAPGLPNLKGLGLDGAAVSLGAGARLVAALALAAAGAHGAARAFGVRLSAPPRPFPALASVRLARMRVAQIAVVALAALAHSLVAPSPAEALAAAMALSLALTAPLMVMAALTRSCALSAGAALAVAAAILAQHFLMSPLPVDPSEYFSSALGAALAGLAAGLLVTLAASRLKPGALRDRFAAPR